MSTSTVHPPAEDLTVSAPTFTLSVGSPTLLTVITLFAIVAGLGSVLGGFGGAVYTYQQAAVQDITTPDDAVLPGVAVRGPLSMWAQSDVITAHQLARTDGLYYAQMDRMVPAVDDEGTVIVDGAGEPTMVPNEARASWLDATALTTSLNLGLLAYALSALAVVTGLALTGLGHVALRLRRASVVLA